MSQRPASPLVRQRTGRPRRRLAALLWALPPALLLAGLTLTKPEPAPIRALRDLAFDTFLQLRPRPYDANAPVRVVDIDEESLARIGQWPWPRTTLAKIVQKIGDAGAAVIALDILIAEPDRTSLEQVLANMGPSPAREELDRIWRDKGVTNDSALAETIGRYPVVVSFVGAPTGGKPALVKAGFSWLGDHGVQFLNPVFSGATMPLAPIANAATGLGVINITPDRDLIVRRTHTLVRIGDEAAPALAMEALRVAQGAPSFLVKASNASGSEGFGEPTGIVAVRVGDAVVETEGDGAVRIHYAGTQSRRRIPAWKILAGDFDPEEARGRIIFFGSSAAALGDVRATPLEQAVAGVDVHAELIEHIAAGVQLRRPDYARGLEAVAIVAAALVAAGLSVVFAPLLGAALAITLAAWLALGSWLSFAYGGLLLDPILPPLALLAGFGSATVAAYRRTEQDRAQIRDAFGRYVSPAVIETLTADPSRLRLGGEIRPVTVMFSDVRNFTQRSEHLDAGDVVRFLNTVHTPMSDAVMRFGGTVDKYIGDGMMAFWNAPLDDPDHVRNALRAALAMIETLPGIMRDLDAGGDTSLGAGLAIGVGIHTGPACVGNLGSTKRFDYSIVGDTVNSAARIEPLCKIYSLAVIASEAIRDAAPEFAFLEIDEVALRGRQAATRLFALVGDDNAARSSDFQALKAKHDRSLAAWRAGDPNAEKLTIECEADPAAAGLRAIYRQWREKRFTAA